MIVGGAEFLLRDATLSSHPSVPLGQNASTYHLHFAYTCTGIAKYCPNRRRTPTGLAWTPEDDPTFPSLTSRRHSENEAGHNEQYDGTRWVIQLKVKQQHDVLQNFTLYTAPQTDPMGDFHNFGQIELNPDSDGSRNGVAESEHCTEQPKTQFSMKSRTCCFATFKNVHNSELLNH